LLLLIMMIMMMMMMMMMLLLYLMLMLTSWNELESSTYVNIEDEGKLQKCKTQSHSKCYLPIQWWSVTCLKSCPPTAVSEMWLPTFYPGSCGAGTWRCRGSFSSGLHTRTTTRSIGLATCTSLASKCCIV